MTIDILIPAYNASKNIEACLRSLTSQSNFNLIVGSIIVVNDGSTDETLNILEGITIPKLKIISHEKNRGRSAAINTGYKHASAPLIIILDSDCTVLGTEWLKEFHQTATSDNKLIVFGATRASGNTFWDQYTNIVANRRLKSESITSQAMTNLLITRELLEISGGFSEAFTHYGFEDKDLLIKLGGIINGTDAAYRNNLIVIHSIESMSIKDLCKKFYESGQYTSTTFSVRNPTEYKKMLYSKFDAQEIPRPLTWLLLIACLTRPILMNVAERLTKSKVIPFSLALFTVRICLVMSYFKGTTKNKH